MKKLLTLILCLWSGLAKAGPDGSGVRAEYDDMMKASGKWGFLSNTFYLVSVLGFAGSYYAYNRQTAYKEIKKNRLLTDHEQNELLMWKKVMNQSTYAAGLSLGLGLVTMGAGLQYENRAHQFAIDMAVKF